MVEKKHFSMVDMDDETVKGENDNSGKKFQICSPTGVVIQPSIIQRYSFSSSMKQKRDLCREVEK